MTRKVRSLGLNGIRGYEVSVECFVGGGLSSFDIVGLPDAAVKEARERVRAAVKTSEYNFPIGRITVNLAPADTRKSGTVYDLPILVGILSAIREFSPLPDHAACFGELSLTGELRAVTGALPMAIAAAREGITELFVPYDNAAEAAYADGLTIYPLRNVSELARHLCGEAYITPAKQQGFELSLEGMPDFSEVKGQENAKRALEIAVSGGHNILISGPPGSGKSMLASRIPSIFPYLSKEEALEITEIHSISGFTSVREPIISKRPFRSPHHTISPVGLSGGGSIPKPGEISLAHNGVLFLDEMPEFSRNTLEILRQPLEDGEVTISRVSGSITYPSRFMLVCAMNPCKCGWFGDSSGRCRCSEAALQAYRSRISGPLVDRIDMFVHVNSLEFSELRREREAEPSALIRERVNHARSVQRKRYGSGVVCNAYINAKQLSEYCKLDSDSEQMMKLAFERMGLTARSYDKILRVSRTIADIEGSEEIKTTHLAEALRYRSFDPRLEEY